MLTKIQDGLLVLRDMGSKYIPEGLKELHTKLKVLQEMVYQGEVHMLATGQKNLTREVEAHLLEKEVRAAIKAGKWPQNLVQGNVNDPKLAAKLAKIFDQSKTAQGWPDLLRAQVTLPGLDGKYYNSLCTFSGKIASWSLDDFAGKTIYRSFGPDGKLAAASNAQGYFWGAGEIPKTAEEWRKLSAVLDEWNANGFIVLVTFPSSDIIRKSPELATSLKGWYGRIAEQFGNKIKHQYLEGGGHQLGMGAMPKELEDSIKALGEKAKATGQGSKTKTLGVTIEVKKSGWVDVEGKYGYAEAGDDLSKYAPSTRRLEADEIKPKTQTPLSNQSVTAGVRSASQDAQKETQ